MVITNIRVRNFKNVKNINIKLHEKVNVLYGKNAQGKTNLVEAMWLCSGIRSFRNTKDKDIITIGREEMTISLDFKNKDRMQNITIEMKRSNLKEKIVTLNGVRQKSLSSIFGQLNCVVFTPEDLELSKGSPDNRRSFIDISISQIKNSYSKVIERYENLLTQRNALLKNIIYAGGDKAMLDIYDTELAKLGSYISMLRYNFVKKLFTTANSLYKDISKNTEKLSFSYQSTVFSDLEGRTDYNDSMAKEYYEALKRNEESDLHCGFTQVGVHRDDILISINKLPTRDFASQGQHRSVALCMKLAQAYILKWENDDSPVIFLDDILSELDFLRQDFVINRVKDMQLFITCCGDLPKLIDGQKYIIDNGFMTEFF